jgi:hypothetical protein
MRSKAHLRGRFFPAVDNIVILHEKTSQDRVTHVQLRADCTGADTLIRNVHSVVDSATRNSERRVLDLEVQVGNGNVAGKCVGSFFLELVSLDMALVVLYDGVWNIDEGGARVDDDISDLAFSV